MKCKKVIKKLAIFLDGQAGEKDNEAISNHLKTCQCCGQEVKELTSLSFLLKQEKESVQASPYFWNKIEQAIIQAETNRNVLDTIWEWVNRTLIPVGATAVVVLGLFVGTNLGSVIYTNIAQILNQDNSSLAQQEINQSLNLNTLNDFPQESIGEIYTGLLAESNLPEQR